MNKIIVYTSNPGFVPKSLDQVVDFAKKTPKFYIASVEMNAHLASVKAGDQIITKKGNTIFVIRTFEHTLDDLTIEEREYIDDLTRNYNLKKTNITSVANVVRYETWCPTVRPLVTSSKESKMNTSNSIKGFSSRLKELFLPVVAKDIRIATDGNICVATTDGYVAINANNELTSYPEELTLNLPAYIINKPKDQLAVGDVIARDRSYAKVTKICDGKISCIGYTGASSVTHTIKDFLLGQTYVRVVVSLAGNVAGNINPLMLFALSDDKKGDSLLPLLMMSQNNGAVATNPLMLAMLAGDGEFDTKSLLMMSALSGNANPFGSLFGSAPAAPVAPVAPIVENKAE